MIHVLASIEVKPGQRDEFIRLFKANVPNVLAEDGCIEYGPAVDVPTEIAAQAPPRAHTVVVVEKWRDLPALQAHLAAPHMVAFRTKVKDMVQSISLQILQPA